VQGDRARRSDEGAELEERPVLLERPGQIRRLVRRPEPAPCDEVGVRCDGSRRIDLQQGEVVDEVDEVCRPGRIQQLGPDSELSSLLAAQVAYARGPD
jgi:hypothetical protein